MQPEGRPSVGRQGRHHPYVSCGASSAVINAARKIGCGAIDSETAEERSLLEEASKKLRGRD